MIALEWLHLYEMLPSKAYLYSKHDFSTVNGMTKKKEKILPDLHHSLRAGMD